MKILWLNANLLLPLDKGGKLRTWHVMRHLAARHDITYLSFCDPDSAEGGSSRACARSARHLHTIPRTDPAKGTARFYARRRALPRRSACRMEWRSTARTHSGARSIGCFSERPLRRRRLRLPRAGRQPARAPSLPGDPLHAQRRGGDLAAARGERRQPGVPVPARAAVAAHAALRTRRARRVSIWCSRCPRPTGDTFQRLYPDALRTPAHVVQTGVDTAYFAPAARARTARAPGLHRVDGLAAERRRHAVLRARHSPAHPPGRARRHAEHHRPRADAGGQASGRRRRHRSDRPGRRCAAAHRRWSGLRRAAAHRRRDAAEDFRSDGDGQGRRLHHGRRRRAAGDTGPEHRHRRRAGPFRAGRRAHDSRRRRAPADRGRGAAHCRRALRLVRGRTGFRGRARTRGRAAARHREGLGRTA